MTVDGSVVILGLDAGLDPTPDPIVPSPFTTSTEPTPFHGPASDPDVPSNCSVYFHASAVSQRISTRTMLYSCPKSTESHSASLESDIQREPVLPSTASEDVPAARATPVGSEKKSNSGHVGL